MREGIGEVETVFGKVVMISLSLAVIALSIVVLFTTY